MQEKKEIFSQNSRLSVYRSRYSSFHILYNSLKPESNNNACIYIHILVGYRQLHVWTIHTCNKQMNLTHNSNNSNSNNQCNRYEYMSLNKQVEKNQNTSDQN